MERLILVIVVATRKVFQNKVSEFEQREHCVSARMEQKR